MKKRIMALALMLIIAFSAIPLAGAADVFTFTDVPTYHKDRIAIEYCARNGFIKGYTDTIFDPDGTLTREQFAVIWARTYHVRMHNFSDVTKIPNEFDNAIIFMQAYGQVNGMSDTEFGRTGRISREQAIAVTQRSYLPGVDGGDAYKNYSDYALISDWARAAVSACKLKGKLDGVFTGATLSPAQPITRGELCHLIFNFMREEHAIKISSSIRYGTVTVEDGKTKAFSGDTVTLKVEPDAGYTLVTGSLKYNNTPITGNTFIMPFEDVTITAEFAPKIMSLSVKTPPTKLTYTYGEKLDLTGMTIEVEHAVGGGRWEVTNYTTTPANGTPLNYTIPIEVIISYTENGITLTTKQYINITSTP